MSETEAKPMWEKIDNETYRMEVPGGWIYHLMSGGEEGIAAVFVPEPSYCPHGSVGLCMTCIVEAMRDGFSFQR
jgi:hypothetical protein